VSEATKDRLFATELNALHPYGVDPVFLPSSSLYDSRLSDSTALYYNSTPGSGEVAATGAPYAFYHRPLQVRRRGRCTCLRRRSDVWLLSLVSLDLSSFDPGGVQLLLTKQPRTRCFLVCVPVPGLY
jgi:hypothetical protein